MLIDDNKIDIFVNERVIGKYDPKIKTKSFNNAISALKFFEDCEKSVGSFVAPEIILLDINMPEIDGFCFFNKLKAMKMINRHHISVFMLSSSSCPDDIKKAQKQPGCAGYIMKPLTIDKLKNTFDAFKDLKCSQDFQKIF